MKTKSSGVGLGIGLGAALGIILGIVAGHIALWLGIGMAFGIAIGSTLKRSTCAQCQAAKQAQQPETESPKLTAHSS
jgi:hypothetical protein